MGTMQGAGLWRGGFYGQEKVFYFCQKGKSGRVKRWVGSCCDPGSPVPVWKSSRERGEAGFASKRENECWEGEDSPLQDTMLGNCSDIALHSCKLPPRQRLLSTCRSVALLPGAQLRMLCLYPGCFHGKGAERLLSPSRGTVCAALIREIPFAMQRNQGSRVRQAGSQPSLAVGPCSSLISLPWHRSPVLFLCSFVHLPIAFHELLCQPVWPG